jgi:hypothetical protein
MATQAYSRDESSQKRLEVVMKDWMGHSSPDDALWDARDVAHYLKTSRQWVYDQSDRGLIPCRRLGVLRRYVPSEIRALAGMPSPDNGGQAV